MNYFRAALNILSVFFPSFLRVRLLKLVGYDIDKNAIIKPLSMILVKNIKLGAHAKIDSFVVIAGRGNVILKEYSGIQRFTYISGRHRFKLGQRSRIGSRCIVNTGAGDIEFGEYSVLAPRSTIYTHGTFLPVTLGYSTKNKGVSVGDYCWIMQSSSIGPGVTIGSNSIVLPGSTIVKQVPSDVVVCDTPVDRKTFPIDVFRKKLSDSEVLSLIREIAVGFCRELLNRHSIDRYHDNGGRLILESKGTSYKIVFDKPGLSVHRADERLETTFFWSFDIAPEVLRTTDYFALDFIRLCSSSVKIPKIFKRLYKFMFFEYGLKFMDIRYAVNNDTVLSAGITLTDAPDLVAQVEQVH